MSLANCVFIRDIWKYSETFYYYHYHFPVPPSCSWCSRAMSRGGREFLGCSQDVFHRNAAASSAAEPFCTRDNWQGAVLFLTQGRPTDEVELRDGRMKDGTP